MPLSDLLEEVCRLSCDHSPAGVVLSHRTLCKRVREMSGRVGVGVAVVIRNGDWVLLGRRKGKHGAGTWSFPGGWMDFGETPAEACHREVIEETNLALYGNSLRPLALKPYVSTHFAEAGVHSLTLYWEAEVVDVSAIRLAEPEKCSKWCWFHYSELPEPLFEPLVQAGMQDVLVRLFEK